MSSDKAQTEDEYKKPKKVAIPLWKDPTKSPSRRSMMLVEDDSRKLAKGCDFRPGSGKRKLLKG